MISKIDINLAFTHAGTHLFRRHPDQRYPPEILCHLTERLCECSPFFGIIKDYIFFLFAKCRFFPGKVNIIYIIRQITYLLPANPDRFQIMDRIVRLTQMHLCLFTKSVLSFSFPVSKAFMARNVPFARLLSTKLL